MAVLLAGSTGESFAAIVLVHNDSSLMVPGDGAILFDETHYNFPIPSNTWTADPGAARFDGQIGAVGIPANASQSSSLRSDAIVGRAVRMPTTSGRLPSRFTLPST